MTRRSVPLARSASRSVPTSDISPATDMFALDSPGSTPVRVKTVAAPSTCRFSAEAMLATLMLDWPMEIVWSAPAALISGMITSSPGAGTRPKSQFDGTNQSPPVAASQIIVAGLTRSSSIFRTRGVNLRGRFTDRLLDFDVHCLSMRWSVTGSIATSQVIRGGNESWVKRVMNQSALLMAVGSIPSTSCRNWG